MDRIKIRNTVREIANKAQLGHKNSDVLANELKNLYEKCDKKFDQTFKDEFIHCLRIALQVFAREPAVERFIEFVAIFLAKFVATDDEKTLYDYVFNYLLTNQSAEDKAVRFRICQLVKLLLQHAPVDTELDSDLVESITNKMLIRMSDTVPAVRAQAARSLVRLQQPRDKKCPIMKEYLFYMRYDESADVRAAVLSSITITHRTLPSIILRTHDAKESVRKLAYQTIAKKISIKVLSVDKRLHLIKQGLFDQSPAVQKVVSSVLLQAWLNTCKGSYVELLGMLDVIGDPDNSTKAVLSLFELSSEKDLVDGMDLLNEKNLIDFSNLTSESVSYWYMMCEYIVSKGPSADHHLDNILPSLIHLCDYIEEYFKVHLVSDDEDVNDEKDVEHEFVAEQLLKLACTCDLRLSDEAGRRKLSSLIQELITSVNVERFQCIVPPMVECFNTLYSQIDSRLTQAANILQDIREEKEGRGLTEEEINELNVQIAKLSVEENEAVEMLDKQIKMKLFHEASETQSEITRIKQAKNDLENQMTVSSQSVDCDLKNDHATILKCLQIVKGVIQSLTMYEKNENGKYTIVSFHPIANEFVQSLILPSIACPHPSVRKLAVECLSPCCLFSQELAMDHLPLYLQIMQADTPLVRIKAMEGVCDILRRFGTDVFSKATKTDDEERHEDGNLVSEDETNSNLLTSVIIKHMVDMLDEDDDDIRLSAASCLIMILVNGCVVSSTIFARLLIMWYNPALQDDHPTINKITTFLDFYPYMNRLTHDCVAEAFLPILRTLQDAPHTSPLTNINIGNVAKLLICLTKPSVIQAAKKQENIQWLKDFSAHDEIAIQICTEILRYPRSVFVPALCRMFELLELTKQETNLKSLFVFCDEMVEKVPNKNALKMVKKFRGAIEGMLPSSQSQEEVPQA